MDGLPTPAVGFAIGIDRLVEFTDLKPGAHQAQVYLVSMGSDALDENFRLLIELRNQGISAYMEYEGKSPKAQFRKANSLQTPFVIVRGDEELKKKNVKLKNMSDGSEKEVSEEDIGKVIIEELKHD